jgi:hypothetical protein
MPNPRSRGNIKCLMAAAEAPFFADACGQALPQAHRCGLRTGGGEGTGLGELSLIRPLQIQSLLVPTLRVDAALVRSRLHTLQAC